MKRIKPIAIIAPLLALALCAGAWAGLAAYRARMAVKPTPAQAELARLQQRKEYKWKEHARLFDERKVSVARIFDKADRVQAFRFPPRDFAIPGEKVIGRLYGGVSGDAKGEKAWGYVAKGPELGHDFAARLGALVLDPKTYPWPGFSDKLCIIEPGMGFRVWSGKEFVDVIVCFKCDQLVVMENDPNVPQNKIGGWLTGRFTVCGDIDAYHDQFVALAREALASGGAVKK